MSQPSRLDPVQALQPSRPTLTDFLDVATLQEVQDAFAALTRLSTRILDAQGRPLTAPTDTASRDRSDRVLDFLLVDAPETGAGGTYLAPIVLEGQQLGTIEVRAATGAAAVASPADLGRVAELAGGKPLAADPLTGADDVPSRAAAVQFLYLLANHITRLCYQEYQLRQRLEELSALYRISTVLAAQRDLQQVLDSGAALAAEAMNVKAVAIRMLDRDTRGLITRAVSGLSDAFLERSTVLSARAALVEQALAGQVVQVADVAEAPQMIGPHEAAQEGVVAMLAVGILHMGRPVGLMQYFTATQRHFRSSQRNLAQAIAQLVATAVVTAQHEAQRDESVRVQRQLRLASDVQQKMLPPAVPASPVFEIAAKFVPSVELAGDFYDFLDLQGNIGLAIGDVAGKGVAAGLLMASVRAALRAYAQDVYDLDEIIRRVNVSLCRDTRDREFATLFYGVLDSRLLRLTYCNAGHDPPLLLRDGKLVELRTGGLLLGVDAEQRYEKALLHLRRGDLLIFYTDGLIDAFDAAGHKFGRPRLYDAVRQLGSASAADAVHHLMWQMRQFIGLRRNGDDTTLVAVRVAAGPARRA